jgi:hypothetical protein
MSDNGTATLGLSPRRYQRMPDKYCALLFFLAAAVCLVAGCSADPIADEVSAEDERVMRTMIDISCKLGVEHIVIADRPAVPRQSDLHDTDGHNVQFGIDFDRRIAREARWPRGKVCPVVRVVSDSAIDDVLAHDDMSWDRFMARFTGAHSVMKISLPVYSRDGKRAVVYTTGVCPYRCGTGFYHELEKTYDGWRIAQSAIAWTA